MKEMEKKIRIIGLLNTFYYYLIFRFERRFVYVSTHII